MQTVVRNTLRKGLVVWSTAICIVLPLRNIIVSNVLFYDNEFYLADVGL